MDVVTLQLLKLNWKIGILQTIAANAYATAFFALQGSQVNQELSEESALEAFRCKLLELLEDAKNQTYQAFFSDSSVFEDERALLAEEFAHVVEEIESSIVPPLDIRSQKSKVSASKTLRTQKKKKGEL